MTVMTSRPEPANPSALSPDIATPQNDPMIDDLHMIDHLLAEGSNEVAQTLALRAIARELFLLRTHLTGTTSSTTTEG